MNHRLGSRVLKVPVQTLILLVMSAIFLFAGLAAYVQPAYEEQTLGYLIPGTIIGAIGVAFFFRQLHETD